ncbi:fibroblast growth factor 21 [Oryzias latipes]|uniref:Fibroblast growth factor n=1 Tax=Oryzias sinensis TaxID=183150 RepID=A0A8C7XU30_9TELE
MPLFTCFTFTFLLVFPLSFGFYIPDSNPLLHFNSQDREVHLYTENHRRGLYLQMNSDGRVTGNDAQTPYSVLQLKSVKPGHVVIKGLSSSLFLCVDSGGHLKGQGVYKEDDCSFRELLLADGYTRFLSSSYGIPLSLASRHSSDRPSIPFTRFLPLRNTLPSESLSEQPSDNQRFFNMDSDDLFGMALNPVISPHLSMEK